MSAARHAAVSLVRELGEPVHFSEIGHTLGGPPGAWAAYGAGYSRDTSNGGYFTAEGILAGVRAAVDAGELVEVEPDVFAAAPVVAA